MSDLIWLSKAQMRRIYRDRGHDANWFHTASTAGGITLSIPSKGNRKVPVPHDGILYRQRRRI